MDAAAIAVLFATFFAAHALWNLIPAVVTFGLLGVVTALAVLLSIRRESLFIAVLGLLGGFATPILLSTGENRPIPLFAYLLLLNIGLSWVAHAKGWPILTWLTLAFTVVYQWGWVFKFLDVSSLPLAMGIFLVFPVVAAAGMIRRSAARRARLAGSEIRAFGARRVGAPAPVRGVPRRDPAYGANAGLLFGFLLLVDLGLLALAIARGDELLHAVGAVTTMVVMAVWLSASVRRVGIADNRARLHCGVRRRLRAGARNRELVRPAVRRGGPGGRLRRSDAAVRVSRARGLRAFGGRPVADDGDAPRARHAHRVARRGVRDTDRFTTWRRSTPLPRRASGPRRT